MDEQLQHYRDILVEARSNAQKSFDKHLLSLSGGALGISIAFVKDIIGNKQAVLTQFALGAWILWTLSVTLVLVSFFTSRKAFDKAIRQLDDDKIYAEHPGGLLDRLTSLLNYAAGASFLVATASFIYFLSQNL